MVRQAFEYAVIRVVPRVDRGEFINAGVLLYSQGADFLQAQIRHDPSRITALDPHADVDAVHAALQGMVQVCADQSWSRRERFGWLTAPRSTVVQCSPVHCGVSDDPAAQLDRLMDRLVR